MNVPYFIHAYYTYIGILVDSVLQMCKVLEIYAYYYTKNEWRKKERKLEWEKMFGVPKVIWYLDSR